AATDAVRFSALAGVDQHRLLDLVQQLGGVFPERCKRYRLLLACIAAHHHHLVLIEVAGTELETNGNSTQLPLVVLRAGLHAFAVVDVNAQPSGNSPLPAEQAFLDEMG